MQKEETREKEIHRILLIFAIYFKNALKFELPMLENL